MRGNMRRSAALLVPLFSARTRRDAGVGEISAIPGLADLARACGCSMLQLLPIGEAVSGDHSPYSSRSAFALDPLYVGLDAVEDLAGPGGFEAALGKHLRVALERARGGERFDPPVVRNLKEHALASAFARFRDRELKNGSERARDFRSFQDEERVWLDDYALFRALEATHGGASWTEWPAGLRDRDEAALAERRAALADLVLYHEYQQWIADRQWKSARKAAAERGVRLAGDLPFMVARDSADLWAHQGDFLLDATVGAPPDPLAPDGQDWDLPPYRWNELGRKDFRWIRDRAHRCAELYDIYRVDHVVGYYRTYVIPKGAHQTQGAFHPGDEPAQTRQGEAVLEAMRAAGSDLIAEDLGTIPPFVRRSLDALDVPGYRVLRWERRWHEPGKPFIDPRTYPARSVATSGTHDTTALALWWERELEGWERRSLLGTLGAPVAGDGTSPEYGEAVRDALLEGLAAAGSNLAILPIQDILGAREQVNVPGTIGPGNWTYRLPFRLDEAAADPVRRARIERFAHFARRHARE